MMNLFALATTILSPAVIDEPVQLSDLKKGATQRYALTFTQKTEGDVMLMDFVVTIGDTKKGQTNVVVKANKVEGQLAAMVTNQVSKDLKVTLNRFGFAGDIDYNSDPNIGEIALMLMPLPDAKVAVGSDFSLAWKNDKAEVKGEGKLEKMVELEGKKLAQITVKCAITPTNSPKGSVETTILFDPVARHVRSSKGTVVNQYTKLAFELKAVDENPKSRGG